MRGRHTNLSTVPNPLYSFCGPCLGPWVIQECLPSSTVPDCRTGVETLEGLDVPSDLPPSRFWERGRGRGVQTGKGVYVNETGYGTDMEGVG